MANVRIGVAAPMEGTPPRFTGLDLDVAAGCGDAGLLARRVETADRGCIMRNTPLGKLVVRVHARMRQPGPTTRRPFHSRCARPGGEPFRFEKGARFGVSREVHLRTDALVTALARPPAAVLAESEHTQADDLVKRSGARAVACGIDERREIAGSGGAVDGGAPCAFMRR